MRVPIRRRGCQLCPAACRGGNAAVQARRRLEHDERALFAHEGEECVVDRRGRRAADADIYIDAMLPQKREPASADQGIRILDRGHNATDARVDDAVHARSRAPLMRARLQRGWAHGWRT